MSAFEKHISALFAHEANAIAVDLGGVAYKWEDDIDDCLLDTFNQLTDDEKRTAEFLGRLLVNLGRDFLLDERKMAAFMNQEGLTKGAAVGP